MPTLKDHIKVLENEINATGKRLETETLTADQLVELGKHMAELGGTLNWLRTIDGVKNKPMIKSIN